MSRHVILPPKPDPTRTPAQPASKEEAEAAGIPTSGAAPISNEKIERIPVAKGTSVLIGGKSYVAQSDAGVTVRSFEHNLGGQPTKVTIIDAPTEEASAFAKGLVESGQMFSEDEIRGLRKKLRLKPGEYLPDNAFDGLRVRRDRLSQAHKAAELRRARPSSPGAQALEERLRAAGIEPESYSVQERLARGKIALLEEQARAAGLTQDEEEEEIAQATTGKVKP